MKAILNPDYSAMDFKKRSMSNAAQKATAFACATPNETPSRASNVFDSAKPLRKSQSFANKENYGHSTGDDIFTPAQVLKAK